VEYKETQHKHDQEPVSRKDIEVAHKEINEIHETEVIMHTSLISTMDEVYMEFPNIVSDTLDLPVTHKLGNVKESF
jgi:hypothetical protein